MESLKNVTFQKELGSYYWKTEQNLAIAGALAANGEGSAASRLMKLHCSRPWSWRRPI